MGIHDRPYYRDSYSGGGGGGWFGGTGAWGPVCKWLIMINLVCWMMQIMITAPTDLSMNPNIPEAAQSVLRTSVMEQWFELDTAKVLTGQIWRIVTCSFLHDRFNVFHILFNMLFLFWFGRTLESMYGSREFAMFYGVSAITASFAFIGIDLITGRQASMIGASGPIMGVLMLFAMHFPRNKIYLFMILPVEIRWIVLLYIIFDLHPVLLMLSGQPTGSGVAHAAHLGGLFFGWLYYRRKIKLEPLLSKVQSKTHEKKVQIVQDAEDRFEDKVDAILDKISEKGIGSLTETEKRMLKKSSSKYKKD